MEDDYFNIHDILSEEQKVKVRFTQDTLWSALLASSDLPAETLIPKGTILLLPFWLVKGLISTNVAILLPPRQFGVKVRADLAAEASSVNLKDLAPYWYSLGRKVSRMIPEGIPKLMAATLSGRLEVLGRAIFSVEENNLDPHAKLFGRSDSLSGLDFCESKIFNSILSMRKDIDGWTNKSNHLLRPLDIYDELKF